MKLQVSLAALALFAAPVHSVLMDGYTCNDIVSSSCVDEDNSVCTTVDVSYAHDSGNSEHVFTVDLAAKTGPGCPRSGDLRAMLFDNPFPVGTSVDINILSPGAGFTLATCAANPPGASDVFNCGGSDGNFNGCVKAHEQFEYGVGITGKKGNKGTSASFEMRVPDTVTDISFTDWRVAIRYKSVGYGGYGGESTKMLNTLCPTALPTESPTKSPTESPTRSPTESPTKSPTKSPTESPTRSPTDSPTKSPTESPTKSPTQSPTRSPTESPTRSPTESPTKSPTESPTKSPTESPTKSPTESPTKSPTESPTKSPTESPTKSPTESPTQSPTESPTRSPTESPTKSPTESPTRSPTESPTKSPTNSPTESPTVSPTLSPTMSPTASPTITIPTMDFFVLLDKSASLTEKKNEIACREILGDPNAENPCWNVFADFVQDIVDGVLNNPNSLLEWTDPTDWPPGTPLTNYRESNFRVQLNAFACTGGQSTPLTFQFGAPLMSYEEEFNQAMLEMRATGIPNKAGTCPGQALEKILVEAETRILADLNNDPLENNRARFKYVLLVTDGIFYDGDRAANAAQAIRDILEIKMQAIGIVTSTKRKDIDAQMAQLTSLIASGDEPQMVQSFNLAVVVDDIVESVLTDANVQPNAFEVNCRFGSKVDELTPAAISQAEVQGQTTSYLVTSALNEFEATCKNDDHDDTCDWIEEAKQCIYKTDLIPCSNIAVADCGAYPSSCVIQGKKKKARCTPVPTPKPTASPTMTPTASPTVTDATLQDLCTPVNTSTPKKKRAKNCRAIPGCKWAKKDGKKQCFEE